MFSNLYPLTGWRYEDANVSSFSSLVATDVVAPVDDAGKGVDLRLSSSCNLVLGADGQDVVEVKAGAGRVEVASVTDALLQISAATDSNDVLLSGLYCRSEYHNDMETIRTNLSDLSVSTSNLVIDGNMHVNTDLFVDGSIIGNTINLMSSNVASSIGYGMSVDNQDELVIYKYDSRTGANRVVARFGKGVVVGPTNAPVSFPSYRGKQSQAASQMTSKAASQAVMRANQNAKFFRR